MGSGTPLWEITTESTPHFLTAQGEGHIAALSSDGRISVVSVAGQAITAIALPRSKSDAPAKAFPVAVQDAGARGMIAMYKEERQLLQLQGNERSAIAKGESEILAFHVSGEFLVVGRKDLAELWTLQGKQRWTFDEGPVVAVTVVGKTVVVLKADGEMVMLPVMSGAVSGRMKLEVPERANTWHLAPIEGSRFALVLGDWLVIVDAAKEKVFRRTRLRAKATALASSERRIVVGLEDGWLQAIDPLTGEIRGAVEAHARAVVSLAIAKTSVVSVAEGSALRGWDVSLASTALVPASPVTALAGHAALIAVGTHNGRIRIQKGVEELGTLRTDGSVNFVHITRNEVIIAVSTSLVVRAEAPWRTVQHPIVLGVPCTAFAADDTYMFSGTQTGSVEVVELQTGKKLTSYELTDASISALARARGVYLVVGTDSLDGRLFVVDVAEATVVHRIEAHQEAFGVTSLAIEPRGKVAASGSDDGSIALIDLAKGRVLARLRVPEAPVSLAFDTTGKRLAAVLYDGTVVLFALDKRAAMQTVTVPPAKRVAWSEGAQSFAIGLETGRIQMAPPGG
jgi:WD40 repeat protein